MKSESIVFVGRLLELPPTPAPRCGDMKVAVGYQFRVRKSVRGKLKDKTVVALIPCPEFKGENFFVVNSDYLLEVSADLQEARSHTTYNDYPGLPAFWTLDVNKA